jgi:hypothetical protein
MAVMVRVVMEVATTGMKIVIMMHIAVVETEVGAGAVVQAGAEVEKEVEKEDKIPNREVR